MFGIKTGKIRVGRILNGEEIIVKTIQFADLKEQNLIINYHAYVASEYNDPKTVKPFQIGLSDVADKISVPFNKKTDTVTFERGNTELKNWMKTNLKLTDDDFTVIDEE